MKFAYLAPLSASPSKSSSSLAATKRLLLLLVLGGILPASVWAQQPSETVVVDKRTLQLLLQRIDQLEARVSQLEAARSVPPTVPPASAAPQANAASPPTSSQAEPEPEGPEPERMDVNRTLLNIRGFGDFGLYGGDQKGEHTSFSLGELNLFITSNINDKTKFLTELVFEVHADNDFEEDLERVLLEYSFNDYLKLSAGRYHTAIGYYNTAYHHTTWFQTTTGRPYLFAYEDEGGILPIHNVGVVASGRIPSGSLGLHYVAEVGNGRTSSSPQAEPVQNFVDENSHKSLNVALFARPEAIPGSQIGFSVYRDVLFPSNSVRIGETILDAYAVLSRSNFEWLNEGVMIRHAPLGLHVYETPGFYTQISKRFGSYRPYLRYEYVNASSNEPVFPQVGLRTGPSVGVRFSASEWVSLKLQYDYTEMRHQQAINGNMCVQRAMCAPSALGLQVGYTF